MPGLSQSAGLTVISKPGPAADGGGPNGPDATVGFQGPGMWFTAGLGQSNGGYGGGLQFLVAKTPYHGAKNHADGS